ncbi:prepilin-type N-terminal cleavage/methylation domain-containing protein [Siminovitchia acidinfaciens]|uniref:ComG operon protein 3 n=1 Tax=Siminovitchia acidinfaciens TaxID=2321395 RepID=A0A429XYL4_9BACI|nr:competence type IV pilus major pilin ComGC [Siminovitchia acidinfaciens]RST73809.1 prepilin-type N-terminal cleavage/methylation domain-containing protein [Siminovitchia acidinfaciens]
MKRFFKNEKGFTLIEMMIVLLVITVLLLIALPNITNHSANINEKGCSGLKHMVQGQVEAYRMDKNEIPNAAQLVDAQYLRDADLKCPDGTNLTIDPTSGKVE